MIRTHHGQHGADCFGCKVRTVQLGTPAFHPHFNHAVGEYVSNDAQFRDALKRGSERNTLATGMDHDYEPHYPGDIPAPTSDTEILETRARFIHDNDINPASLIA